MAGGGGGSQIGLSDGGGSQMVFTVASPCMDHRKRGFKSNRHHICLLTEVRIRYVPKGYGCEVRWGNGF